MVCVLPVLFLSPRVTGAQQNNNIMTVDGWCVLPVFFLHVTGAHQT
jgi:hypothetical protein